MLVAPKNNYNFVKMSGAGNDFVIFDARKENITLTSDQIQNISDRRNIGCDQLIIIKKAQTGFDCEMEIYNCDGSKSGACGNATRCVAAIICDDLQQSEIKIKTAAGVLECKKNGELISVNMGKPKFTENISLFGFDFKCADVGNPHAVTFIKDKISDQDFFEIGSKVENNSFFPSKTNVEFAQIISDELIEVRVFERGVGETLACGSGACAVATLAMKNSLINSKKVTIRFTGGDLIIEQKDDSSIIMTGGYEKITEGTVPSKIVS
jgi:diaminopimelate epimerase